jgi:type VI protein secretion system component VasK
VLNSTARLTFDPPPAGQAGGSQAGVLQAGVLQAGVLQAGVLQESGSWSMFRLFGRGKLHPGASPDRYTLTFQIGDRQATFELRASSGFNPFTPNLLQDFRCPEVGGS